MELSTIKLIIWDLDETFWKGTISEEHVELIEKNVLFLKKTTDMGIIHSICSKNDYEDIKKFLSEKNLWDFFVFPSVSWDSKGARVKNIIESANLRAANVLFVDDNPQNLEEVKFFCKGILTALPDEIHPLYEEAEKANATDGAHKRLAQYKNLERKLSEKREYSSNEEFLYSCNIKVSMHGGCVEEIDRISELVARSNQLNFTKRRQSKEEILDLIKSDNISSGYVSASDKYGDYGIIGFFAICDNELIHFTFSCRTLGMKIEQYVYFQLGCPKLEIVGDVAVQLNNYEHPMWINQTHEDSRNSEKKEEITKKILLKGPCDMSQIFTFISENDALNTEFSYTNDSGILIEGHNHTAQIVTALTVGDDRKQEIISEFDFFDKDQYTTALTTEKFDYVVLSMLTDGNLGLYRSKTGTDYVALCEKYYDLTDEKNKEKYLAKKIFTSNINFTESDIEKFAKHYTFVENDGDITVNQLEIIRSKLDIETKLILILGSEREFENETPESYKNRHTEHAVMNKKIREWAKRHDNVIIKEFDSYIRSKSDFLDTINHFVKRVYYDLAVDLVSTINGDSGEKLLVKSRFFLIVSEFMRRAKQIVRGIKKSIKK